MAKTFKLELLAADRPFFVGECEHLIYPAQDGLVGVLPGHESLVTIVSPGEIQYKVDGEWRYAAISEGFAEIRSDYALILGDTIECRKKLMQSVPQKLQLVRKNGCGSGRVSCNTTSRRQR